MVVLERSILARNVLEEAFITVLALYAPRLTEQTQVMAGADQE